MLVRIGINLIVGSWVSIHTILCEIFMWNKHKNA